MYFGGRHTASAARSPVIGKKCKSCKKQIVLASDGMRCEQCGAPLHTKKCAEKHARKAHGPAEPATPYRS